MKKMNRSLWVSAIIVLLSFKVMAGDPDAIYMWKFNCGPLNSKPVIRDSIAYFSTTDSNLFAVNINSGNEIWHYKADRSNSFPALKDSIIVFEAKNKLYALHALTGIFFWSFTNNENAESSLGTTDYHHSSPVIIDSLVIFCDQSGYINGIDLKTGELKYQFLTDGQNALRGTPAVKDSIVFAGDWEGNIYAVSLKDSVQIWKHVMQNARPYYGAVVSEMVIKDNVLYFGSQHDVFSPLDIHTGEPVWTYIDPRATYLPPTPVFYEDKIIIGTTIYANQIMCFENNASHQQVWSFQASDIFFTTPTIKDSILLMNSCNFDNASGHLYFLNCKNGKLIRQMEFNNTGPYMPVLHDTILFIGTNNGLYAADFKAILAGKGSQITFNTNNEELKYKENDGRKRYNLNVSNAGNVCDSIFADVQSDEIIENMGFITSSTMKIQGKFSLPSYLYVYTDSLPAGIYHIAVTLHSQNEPDLNLTKNITVTIEESISGIQLNQSNSCPSVFPNPASEYMVFAIKLDKLTDINMKIYSVSGKLIMTKSHLNVTGTYEYVWDLTNINNRKCPKGEYVCVIDYNGETFSKKFIIN